MLILLTSHSSPSVNLVIRDVLDGNSVSDAQKLEIIRERKPAAGCSLPFSHVKDKRKQSRTSQRFLQRSLFDKHQLLGYYDGDGDLSKTGVFCIPCVLFPTVHRDGSRRADNLITKFHRNFKMISGDADIHGGL